MKPLRLLYLLPAEGFGGAERQGVHHLRGLPRHGIEVTAVVGPGEPLLRALTRADVPYRRFRHFPDRTHSPSTPQNNIRYLGSWLVHLRRSVDALERMVRWEPCDLIFANRTFAWLVAAAVSRRTSIPYVIRAGSRAAHRSYLLGLPLLDRAAPPTAVFTNSQAVESEIASHFHAPHFLLRNAVDTEEFSPGPSVLARARLGLPARVPLIGLAARPAPEKGFELLGRVVTRVRMERPDALFLVAGEFGWRTHYEQQLRREGHGDTVRFLGHVDDMADFYRAVDVVVLTSRARSIEASPNALLEAMATARPVVTTAVGGIPELIDHGREGYLTGENDDAAFADHLLDLLEWPERRLDMGRAGRSRAVSRHRVESVIATLARDLWAIAAIGAEDTTATYRSMAEPFARGA